MDNIFNADHKMAKIMNKFLFLYKTQIGEKKRHNNRN